MDLTPSSHFIAAESAGSSWRFSRQDLIEQINAGRFMLLRQPIIRLDNLIDSDFYAEICLRWMPEESEHSTPGTFLAVLEEAGLIQIADQWVIHCIAKVIHTENKMPWIKSRPRRQQKKYSINLSEQTISSNEIGTYTGMVLRREGLSGSQIVFESSFSAAIRNQKAFARLADEIADLGCEISLSGNPTVDQLVWARKMLRIRYIKLDFSGGNSIDGFRRLEKKYKNLIYSCKRLDILSIAQFVEDPGVISFLQETGIDFVQGFGLALPSLIESKLGLPFSLPEQTLTT